MKYFITSLICLLFFIVNSHADIIKDIEIKNNKRISKETIITYGDIKIDNQILIIDVKENKIIQTVKIEGIKSNSMKEAILENLFSKDKSPFLVEKVKLDETRMKNNLNSVGYYLSDVKSKIVENNNDTVDLIFEVDLGEKSKISKIEFIGDKKIKDRTLRSVIISEEAKFWKVISNKKYVNKSIIERDKRLLRNFYLSKGYYDVEIDSATVKFLDNKSFKLSYKIDAGDIYTINDTKLILPVDYDENNFEEVKKQLNKLINKTYSINKISKIVDEIDKISLSRQYDFINASFTETTLPNNQLNITFTVIESEKSYVEKINIYGNNITHESIIRNQLEIDEGDPFNELLSAKSINNLKSLNIFKTIDASINDGESPNTKIIDINVEEKPTGEIMVGAGAGTEGGTIGFAVSENNFLGKGIRLGTNLDITEDSIKGSFSVTNPNFNYTGKSLSTSVQSTNIDKLSESGYKTTKTGFTFGTGFEQFENTYFRPRISSYFEDLTTNSKASANLKKQSGNYFETRFGYSLDNDYRNQRFQTSEGHRLIFGQGIPLISDEYALSNSLDMQKWFKINEDFITNLSFYHSKTLPKIDFTSGFHAICANLSTVEMIKDGHLV